MDLLEFMMELQSWTKLLRRNRKTIFQRKNPSPPQINVVSNVLCFSKQNFARLNIDIEGNGGNSEFEKLTPFLNLQDCQPLSQQVLSRVVRNF